MKREDGELEEFEERNGSSDTVDTSEEDEGTTGVSEEEVVEVEVLKEAKGRSEVSPRKGRVARWKNESRRKERELTFSLDMHSILDSWRVETIPSSEERSMISGSASRKSSFSKRSSGKGKKQRSARVSLRSLLFLPPR